MRQIELIRSGWLVCSLGLITLGCSGGGEPMGHVSGKVTFGGVPVTEGSISFLSKGRSGAGTLAVDGSFKIIGENGGIPPGDYKIVIVPPTVELPSDGTSSPVMAPKEMPNIPEKYRLEETTDLKATVKEGANDIPVTLK